MKTLSILILCALLIAGCSRAAQVSNDPPPPAPYSSPTSLPQVFSTDDPALESIRASFSSGPHASQFSCADCHGTSATIGTKLNWVDPSDGKTEVLSTPTELCLKCHPKQGYGSNTQDQTTSPHTDEGCTGCHNAHTTQASCTSSVCHNNIQIIFFAEIERPEPHPTSGDPNAHMCGGSACHEFVKQIANEPVYHRPIHNKVPCSVCHDGSGMTVMREENQTWVTVPGIAGLTGTDGTPVVSHIISREVSCSKCHYKGNPWGVAEFLPKE